MSLIGNMASAPPVLTSGNAPEVRPLPSPGVTRLQRYYEPVRLPAQPETSLTGFRLVANTTGQGLPCYADFLLWRAVVITPAGPSNGDRGSFPLNATAVAFPFVMESRLLRCVFSGPARRSLRLRPDHSLNRKSILFHPRLRHSQLPAKSLGLLPARMTKLPGGIRTH